MISPAESSHNIQIFTGSDIHGINHLVISSGIHGYRFFAEDMNTFIDSSFDMNRPESRRRSQQHDIQILIHKLLIGVESNKLSLLRSEERRVGKESKTQ